MNKTWFEQGLEQGMERGQRAILYELLEARFGSLSPAVQERLRQLPAERLAGLARAILRAQSLQDLGLGE